MNRSLGVELLPWVARIDIAAAIGDLVLPSGSCEPFPADRAGWRGRILARRWDFRRAADGAGSGRTHAGGYRSDGRDRRGQPRW